MIRISQLIILIFLTSCAGYRYQEKSNPFERFGVSSLQIPMFYNQSSIPNASSAFTREFKTMLFKYKGLKIISQKSKKVDGVLIGIIESDGTKAETISNQTLRIADNAAGGSVGDKRRDFYIPASSNASLRLRIFLIKNPTNREIKVLQSEFGKYIQVDSKILISEVIPLSGNFNRELYDGEAGNINYTQNQGALKSTVDTLAKSAVDSFRSLILYAF